MTSTTPHADKLLSAARNGLSELRGISRRAVITLCVCGALGIAGICGASTVESDIPMTGSGLTALIIGAAVTIFVGVGLMSLIFFSSRVKVRLGDFGYYQLGVFDLNEQYLGFTDKLLPVWYSGSSGVLLPVELAWLPRFGDGGRYRPATSRVGRRARRPPTVCGSRAPSPCSVIADAFASLGIFNPGEIVAHRLRYGSGSALSFATIWRVLPGFTRTDSTTGRCRGPSNIRSKEGRDGDRDSNQA